MFARNFSVRLKPNSVSQFTDIEKNHVIPAISKLPGFRDLMAFVSSSGTEVFVITLWDSPESAEAYGRGAYPRLVESLATVTDGTPVVETYSVSNSTWHNIATAATA